MTLPPLDGDAGGGLRHRCIDALFPQPIEEVKRVPHLLSVPSVSLSNFTADGLELMIASDPCA
ncbi:hypothetical protein [Roseateles chitinivorans]|uniref:hypothetical protein n=1 Tax=Roseateles chitinivorans TaxID=2917965 RepID=UPI003D668499